MTAVGGMAPTPTRRPVGRARLTAATDGSALSNPGHSAWAWVVAAPANREPSLWAAGYAGIGTNNAAELKALTELLRALPEHLPLTVKVDSQYVINAVTRWAPGWARNNWRTKTGGHVANRDLIEEAATRIERSDVKLEWVKAHQRAGGHKLNEFADNAARKAARAGRAGLPVQTGPGWPH